MAQQNLSDIIQVLGCPEVRYPPQDNKCCLEQSAVKQKHHGADGAAQGKPCFNPQPGCSAYYEGNEEKICVKLSTEPMS